MEDDDGDVMGDVIRVRSEIRTDAHPRAEDLPTIADRRCASEAEYSARNEAVQIDDRAVDDRLAGIAVLMRLFEDQIGKTMQIGDAFLLKLAQKLFFGESVRGGHVSSLLCCTRFAKIMTGAQIVFHPAHVAGFGGLNATTR
jgi:hypothetical protein